VKIITALPPLIVLLGLLFQPRAGHLQVITDVLSIQMEGASLYADPSNWNRTGDFYLVVFTVLPLFSVVKIAGAGLLNDKASRSLEPLLATPLTGGELFSGKVLAAVAPAVLGSWASFLVFAATLAHLGVATTAIFGPFKGSIWLLAVFVIGPLLALFQALFTLWVCAQTGGADRPALLVLQFLRVPAAIDWPRPVVTGRGRAGGPRGPGFLGLPKTVSAGNHFV
jgi:hypothetical protein